MSKDKGSKGDAAEDSGPGDPLQVLREDASGLSATPPIANQAREPGRRFDILILEDDPLRMVQFRSLLNGHNIFHYETAKHATEALALWRYDLILLDHDLGGRTYVDHTDAKEDCGMRIAEWFSIRPERVAAQGPIIVHSLNGPAAQQMVELIGEAVWIPFLWTQGVWNKFLKLPRVSDCSRREERAGPKDGTGEKRGGVITETPTNNE